MSRAPIYLKDLLVEPIAQHGYEIGDWSYGTPWVAHWGEPATLKVGRYCSIANDVYIFVGGNHRIDWVTTYPFSALAFQWPNAEGIPGHPATKGDVVIGNDVWIGMGATVLSGITIGDGAVIATRSVVTNDVPAYGIVGGNPARLIRHRFSPDVIERLLAIRWWDWPEERVNRFLPLLLSEDIEAFITAAQHASGEESWGRMG